MILSTSPWSKPTHWKQTVIVTENFAAIEANTSENKGNRLLYRMACVNSSVYLKHYLNKTRFQKS